MNNLKIAKLYFDSPFHFSSGKPNSFSKSEQMIHSDSLVSAIYATAILLFGEEEINEGLLKSFTLSSAFPFYREELFFPKPMKGFKVDKLLDSNQQEIAEGAVKDKINKKIKWIGLLEFQKVLAGGSLIIKNTHFVNQSKTMVSSKLAPSSEQGKLSVTVSDLQQRVNVCEEKTFYVERVFFSEGGGLYFIVNTKNDTTLKQLSFVLDYLSEEGVGMNKNVGFGKFQFNGFEDFPLDAPENGDDWVNLSLYCPKDKEEIDEVTVLSNSAYQLIKRGGWVANARNKANLTYRKKSIFMFREGSVFHFGKQDKPMIEKGKIEDLKPKDWNLHDHPIHRDGRGMFFPIIV